MQHLSEQSIDGYLQRKLLATELFEVDAHLATCEECYQRVRASHQNVTSRIQSTLADLSSPPLNDNDHLTYEQLAGLVDNESDEIDREIALVHLEVCGQCAEELHALQKLREPQSASEREAVSRSRAVPKWSLFPRLTWPRFAMAALVALASTALLWVVWRSGQPKNVEVAHPGVTSSPTPSSTHSPIQPDPSPIASPRILVALNDGSGRVTLDHEGNIDGLGDLPATIQGALKEALANKKLKIQPALAGLIGKTGVLMGAAGEGVPFALIEPIGVVLRTDQPTLRWQPLNGATAYVVKVYDTTFKELAASTPQQATSWRVPASLPRGAVCVWQVTATKDGEEIRSPTTPAPEARFKVLSREMEVEIQRVQKTHANSHLLLGTLYAEAGLLEDAQREFRLLLRANPGSPLVQTLLQEISRAKTQIE